MIFSKGMTKVSADDKALVPIGEPGHPVRTNVRPISAKIVVAKGTGQPDASDHDFHRASIRPSLALICQGGGGNWRKGQVVFNLKDSATQKSTAMRHAVESTNQIKTLVKKQDLLLAERNLLDRYAEKTTMPYTFLDRTDGGSDRNPKNISVQLAGVYKWLALDLDIYCCIITAADISAVNEVEGGHASC